MKIYYSKTIIAAADDRIQPVGEPPKCYDYADDTNVKDYSNDHAVSDGHIHLSM